MKKILKYGCGCTTIGIVIAVIIAVAIVYKITPKWHDEYGQRYQDVAYGDRKGNTYDLYLPKSPGDGCDTLSLILFVHGGAWLGGDKEFHSGDCYTWVQKGYATATMNYSLLGEEGVSILTMLDDIDACIRHIIGFAQQKGIILNQMAIAGTSAGGHLAMMYAYSREHALPLRFEAVKVGPSDLRVSFPYDYNASEKDIQNFIFNCTGKHMDAKDITPERLDSIKLSTSPIHYISDTTALPAIWAYGEKDGLVTPEHYKALKERYDSVGKPYSLIVFPNSDHMLLSDKDCMDRYDSTMAEYCKKYFGY